MALGSPMNAVFHNNGRSSAAYRVRIAAALKGLQLETRDVDLRAGAQHDSAYVGRTSSALVPSLTFADDALTQSLAILVWLDRTAPEPRLVPEDSEAAAYAWEIALAIACDIHPLNNLRVLQYLTGPLGVSEDGKLAWYRHWIETGFRTVEGLLARRQGRGPYCLGSDVTIADVCLVPQAANARRYEIDIAAFPRIVATDAALRALPAFREAAPKA
jgi:maleylacetoacetate isomerase